MGLLLFTLQSAYAGTACEPVWEEDFTGPLDDTVWNVVEGDGCAEGICGWGNNEAQSYDEAGVSIDDGILKLTASTGESFMACIVDDAVGSAIRMAAGG